MESSLYSLIDLMIAFCGLYVIVEYAAMVRTKKLRTNMLLPKEVNLSRCKDQEGYIKYIGNKQLAFGVTACINGILGLLQDYKILVVPVVTTVAMILFIISAGFYVYAYKQGLKKFWKI